MKKNENMCILMKILVIFVADLLFLVKVIAKDL